MSWCRRRDLNPHGLRHTPLKRACLPFHHFGLLGMLKKTQRLRSRGAQILDVPGTVRLESSLAAALPLAFLNIPKISYVRVSSRGSGIIEVAQNPCQST